jgi:hypothetical protein
VVQPAGTPLAARLNELPEPSWRLLLGRGLPQFAFEAVVPVAVFYSAWREFGLGEGIVASTACSLLLAAILMRRGRDVGLVAASALFVVIQALIGLASGSTTVYLAQPVLFSGLWGIAYLGSVLVRRPLTGTFASAWYPFPDWFRASRPFIREFSLQSLVWSAYCFARAGLRLAILLHGDVGAFVVVSLLTGTPVIVALVAWGVWHARRTFDSGGF